MTRLAYRLLLFAGLFLAYDKLFILVANRSAEAEVDKRLEYLVNGEMNKDIIIAGSSTGSRDIIASQLEMGTGLSTCNLCYPGSNVEFHEFIIRTLLRFNTPPRILLLVVDDDTELLNNETTVFRQDRLYPLVKYPYIQKELSMRQDKDMFMARLLMLERLNKYNFNLKQKRFSPIDTLFECGSMPISWKPDNIQLQYDSAARPYPLEKEITEKVDAFKDIVEVCHENEIELILVFPPAFKSLGRSFEKRMRELAGDDVPAYVYNTDNPIYKDAAYFYDGMHLLRTGAEIFTRELGSWINARLKSDG